MERQTNFVTLFVVTLIFTLFTSAQVSKVRVADNGDGKSAREGFWMGAKIGVFFTRLGKFNNAGTVDIDWFRVEKYYCHECTN